MSRTRRLPPGVDVSKDVSKRRGSQGKIPCLQGGTERGEEVPDSGTETCQSGKDQASTGNRKKGSRKEKAPETLDEERKRRAKERRLELLGPKESKLQREFFIWVDALLLIWPELENVYAVPNGATLARGPAAWMILKYLGARAGTLDISIDIPAGPYHGMKIEMKRLVGGMNPDQERRYGLNNRLGYLSVVCRSGNSAIECLNRYLKLRWPDFPNRKRNDK